MKRDDTSNDGALSRRDFLAASVLAGTAVAAEASAGEQPAARPTAISGAAVAPPAPGVAPFTSDGSYPVVALRSENVVVAMMQTRVRAVDGRNPAPGLKANLEHMLWCIDAAQYYGVRKDYLAFHEFPITGWDKWSRAEVLRLALDVPGPETEAIGALCRKYNCYVSFGTYARDPAWPGHVISMTVYISPEGKIISRQWKHRNIHSMFAGFELFTSSVYDVLDRYVEMYGWDAVIPVARTDIGNLCASPCVNDPELYRCMTLKGAEFIVRTATGGTPRWASDMPVWCRVNRVYGGIVNNSISPDNPHFLESGDNGTVLKPGGSAIFGPDGNTIADTLSQNEDSVVSSIPMAAFRKSHRLPDVFMPMYRHLYDAFPARIEPGGYSKSIPDTLEAANALWKQKVKW